MNINTTMPKSLVPFYNNELAHYKNYLTVNNCSLAWHHLERAHVLGQPYPFAHTVVHFKMLQFGFKIKNTKEIIGQLPRLLIGGVKSFIGKIPTGNTGGANVPPFQHMKIPLDLQIIINNHTS
jgi:hypothetical protein